MPGSVPFPTAETGLALRRAPALPELACPWPVLPARRPEPLPERLPGPLPETRERPCPVPRLIRRTGLGLVLSALFHAGMAAAALIILPAQHSEEAERGGAPAIMEVTLVGEAEALAAVEGARADPVSLALPDVPAIDAVVVEPAPPVTVPEVPPIPEPAILEPAPPLPDIVLPEPPSVGPAEIAIPPVPRSEPKPRYEPKARPETKPPVVARRAALPNPKRNEPVAARHAEGHGRGREGTGQQAANRDAASRAGTGGTGSVAGSALTAAYGARVRALIERQKSYPEAAQDRGQTGRTTIALVISRDGKLASVTVARGSGHALLDAATLAAVRRAQPFPALPEGGPPSISFQLSIGYELH
ncbi:MAG: TonB family protein [Beijerinckiaceae bacterium]|nr:TonB family protein [Beijerinckiaceae bacterium]